MTATDPTTAPVTEPALAWGVGTSDVATEVVVGDGAVVSVGLFASCPLDRGTYLRARALVGAVFQEVLISDPTAEPTERLLRAAEAADQSLRDEFSPTDPEGRGAALLARADRTGVVVVGTASATAYRVRGGAVVAAWTPNTDDTDFTSLRVHQHLGGRPSDAGGLDAAWMGDPWPPGETDDRIVLATRNLRILLRGSELATLASGGSAEAAAQTIAEACRVRGGVEVAVAVLQWGAESVVEAGPDAGFSELLASLAGIEGRLAEHSLPPMATPIDDDATAGFAPTREHSASRGEAELSLAPHDVTPPGSLASPRSHPEPVVESPHAVRVAAAPLAGWWGRLLGLFALGVIAIAALYLFR